MYQFLNQHAQVWPSLNRSSVENIVQDITDVSLEDGGNEDTDEIPTGVFVLLANCYSPTCSMSQTCYTVFCPKRLAAVSRTH